MKREELKPVELENNLGKDVNGVVHRVPWKAYDIEEVDNLLNAMEQRIKKLEQGKGDLQRLLMHKYNRIKELEAKLKEKDEAMDTCRGLIESANVMSKSAKDKLLNRINELEAQLENVQSSMYAENVDANMALVKAN